MVVKFGRDCLHRAKWAISGRGSRDELAPDFEVNQVAIKILCQLITVQYVMSAYVDQCMGVCECEVEVFDSQHNVMIMRLFYRDPDHAALKI